jgi:hypothetical protein
MYNAILTLKYITSDIEHFLLDCFYPQEICHHRELNCFGWTFNKYYNELPDNCIHSKNELLVNCCFCLQLTIFSHNP